MVGVTQQAISAMVSDGKITTEGTLGEALQAYCQRLRDQAAGRLGNELGGLDLVQERAALARSQRESQELKNQIARGEYAPIGVLADVLGMASSAVVDRFDLLEGTLRKTCPEIDEDVMTAVLQVVASARNQWVKSTSSLIDAALDSMVDDEPAPDDFQDDDDLETEPNTEGHTNDHP